MPLVQYKYFCAKAYASGTVFMCNRNQLKYYLMYNEIIFGFYALVHITKLIKRTLYTHVNYTDRAKATNLLMVMQMHPRACLHLTADKISAVGDFYVIKYVSPAIGIFVVVRPEILPTTVYRNEYLSHILI